MLDFIQTILTIVGKALPAIATRQREKRASKIGAELFLFYVQVNEAIVCAENIIDSLETYVERMGLHHEYALTAGEWIEYQVEKQCINLARIGETMAHWREQLQILDGESFAKIIPLLRGKANALDSLLQAMRAKNLPLSVSQEDLENFARKALDAEASRDEKYRLQDEFANDVLNGSVSLQSPWDSEVCQVVVTYLQERNPRQQIAQIRTVLEKIRAALVANFSIQDVIMEVGDKRFDIEYGGDYFW
jgi:hypothetical protein